ncbi:MAG: nicotinate (nicotinamide) nucleotide adenylyltransferase [Candidatus Riflebacteria bacterium]|nr:nicotinate (nicotinamide) nucleotide adenylyltransferase [Candidatus Riflebacteria bacterium]
MIIGLFGGSFNPPHKQHIKIAQKSLESGLIDEVWFIPVFLPVHKSDTELISFSDRCEMLKASIQGKKGLKLSEVERELDGPSFTIRTIRHLKKQNPFHDYFLIIGSDSLNDLKNWKSSAEIIAEAGLIVASRPGYTVPSVLPSKKTFLINIDEDPVSSTEFRKKLKLKNDPFRFVPPGAAAIIAEKNLYNCWGTEFRTWVEQIRLKHQNLPTSIINHLAGTASLAARYSAELTDDPRLGWLAGISHDLFRASPDQEILNVLSKSDIPLFKKEREIPMLGHGAAAACFLKNLDPNFPKKVITSVRMHTFPRVRCGKIEKALVMGDFLDPSRESKERSKIREMELTPQKRFEVVCRSKREKALKKQLITTL